MLLTGIIEVVFSLGLFINAALFVPQIIKLYRQKDSAELSLLTFSGFNLIQLSMVLHAYLHDDYILLIGSFLSLVTCGAVTCLIIIYRIIRK